MFGVPAVGKLVDEWVYRRPREAGCGEATHPPEPTAPDRVR
jgi:hypothetical protein